MALYFYPVIGQQNEDSLSLFLLIQYQSITTTNGEMQFLICGFITSAQTLSMQCVNGLSMNHC